MKNLYMTHAIRYEQSLKMILPMLRLYNESALIQIKKQQPDIPLCFIIKV